MTQKTPYRQATIRVPLTDKEKQGIQDWLAQISPSDVGRINPQFGQVVVWLPLSEWKADYVINCLRPDFTRCRCGAILAPDTTKCECGESAR